MKKLVRFDTNFKRLYRVDQGKWARLGVCVIRCRIKKFLRKRVRKLLLFVSRSKHSSSFSFGDDFSRDRCQGHWHSSPDNPTFIFGYSRRARGNSETSIEKSSESRLGRVLVHRISRTWILIFSKTKLRTRKILLFDLLFHVESLPVQFYYQLSDTQCPLDKVRGIYRREWKSSVTRRFYLICILINFWSIRFHNYI